jgi:hypothetical protein
MPNTALARIIIGLILTLALGMQVVELAMANPIPWSATPNLEEPILAVQTPQNGSTNDGTNLFLNFTVTLPNSWEVVDFITYYLGRIASVEVYLDGNYYGKAHGTGSNSPNYSVELNQTQPGQHSLNVTVQFHTYYRGPAFDNTHIVSDIYSSSGPVYQYPRAVSDVVYFTVEQPAQSSSPKPIDSNYSLSQTFYAAIVMAAVIVVALTSLVYVRKRKLSFVKNR